jgi:hypothetical protein
MEGFWKLKGMMKKEKIQDKYETQKLRKRIRIGMKGADSFCSTYSRSPHVSSFFNALFPVD